MNIKKSIQLRARITFLVFFIFAVAIIFRIAKIQFAEGKKWSQISQEVNLQYKKIKATRGNIYSDNGSLLATSLPFYKVVFDPTVAKDEIYKNGIDSLCYLLEKNFRGKSARAYKRMINDAREANKKYIILSRRKVDYQEKKKMLAWPIFREGRWRGGVIFEKIDIRFSPFNSLTARTIGFINERGQGAGLEYSFNRQLKGKDGEALYQKITGGNWKPVHDGSEVRPQHGFDIETTININLQDVAESALLRALEEHRADYGSVVVMEVKTGEIKAISNLSRRNGKYSERYNYAIGDQGLREPGSTFKLASMIALFEDTNVHLSDSVDTGNGKYKFRGRTIRDAKPGGYGKITVQQVFEKSSNIGTMKLVDNHFGLNPENFIEGLGRMGLSKPLGFQMKGEGVPYIKNTKDPLWSGISLPWMSIGYELRLTPLQILSFYNAIANDGRMIRPIIVKRIKRADQVVREFEAVTLNKKICSKETLKKVKIMLEGVVDKGTANNIANDHYKIAGKTGTAQIFEGGRYTRSYYTSFVGYFPADKPKYSCIVVIDKPKGFKQYGNSVAAPVFKEIADRLYAQDIKMHDPLAPPEKITMEAFPVIRAGYKEDLAMICNEFDISNRDIHQEEWVKTRIHGDTILWRANRMHADKIPDVKGMTLKDALYILENKGLRVVYYGKGRVTEQSQEPGKKMLRGETITLKLG